MWKRRWSLWLVVTIISRVAAALPSSCSFDDGWCQWRPQNNLGNFAWHLGNGTTRDRSSGPDGDHTTKYGNGSYIFIRGLDAGRNASIKAVVETILHATSDLQMSFWYFMNGIGIGNLTVNKVDDDGTKTELWRKEGRQGPEWIQAKVRLSRGSFLISLEASAHLFYGSDLAVDDIEITSFISTTTLPPTTTMPSFRTLPVACDFDFESGSCGWELLPSLGNTVGWNITSESYHYKEKMLIPGDMSKNQGKYLLLTNWNMGENGDAAQIISPVLGNADSACLSLYLYLTSITSGTLSIYQKLLPSMELVLLHEAAYRRPPGWKEIKFTLKDSPYFQVILEGSYTGYLGSVIGVDNITIENGECIFTTTPATTTSSTTTLPTTVSTSLSTTAKNSKTTAQKVSPLSSSPEVEKSSPKHTTKLKNSTLLVGISSEPTTAQGSSTLSSSMPLHMSFTSSSWSSTQTSFTTSTPTRTTRHSTKGTSTINSFPPMTSTLSDKSSLVSSTQVPQTATHSSIPESSEITLHSHVASKSSPQTIAPSPSPSSTSPSRVSSTKERVTALNSSLSSSQASIETHIPPIISSLLSSIRSTTVLATTEPSFTQKPTRTLSLTVNATKPTSENTTSLSASSSRSSVTSVILSSLLTNVSAMISNFQPTVSKKTTTMSKLSTVENHIIKHTSPLSIQTPDMKTTTAIKTQAPDSSSTTRLPSPATSTKHQTSPSSNLSPEKQNLVGRETTAIVLGVCLPVIALVILSVIVLICKKDQSKASSFINNKTQQNKTKKQAGNEVDINISLKTFRTIETGY